ncbi:uncharacterized protein [Dysidea avara]|uniref:uncharacterized protein isoform X2 n=1 Tax=Dysidea avara TaxID=196820 RepID=UPI00331AAA99
MKRSADFITKNGIDRRSLSRQNLSHLKEAIKDESDDVDVATVCRRALHVFDSEMWDNFVKEYADTKKRVRMIAEETFSLELTTKQECNAVLFIFDMAHTHKLTLKLSSLFNSDVLKLHNCSISTDSLFYTLRKNNARFPRPNGTIVDKGRKGNLRIFVYKFDKEHVTQCSKASLDNFKHCHTDEERPFVPEMKLERNVAWSFFCLDPDPALNLTEHFIDPKSLNLKPLFAFPEPKHEAERMKCLYNALVKNLSLTRVDIAQVMPPGNTDHFCQFSGGGDIHITIKKESLVISDVRDDSHSSQQQDDYPSHPSPIEKSDLISGFAVEEKKLAVNKELLKCQLFGDIIVHSVGNFIACIDECNEDFIRNVDCVEGYGAAYTGTGCIGFYKVEMKFGQAVKIVTKFEMNMYNPASSAAILDSALNYFMNINFLILNYSCVMSLLVD